MSLDASATFEMENPLAVSESSRDPYLPHSSIEPLGRGIRNRWVGKSGTPGLGGAETRIGSPETPGSKHNKNAPETTKPKSKPELAE